MQLSKTFVPLTLTGHLRPFTIYRTCTELECGQLSSSSDSDESNEDAENLQHDEDHFNIDDGEGENDVEEETMLGEGVMGA